MILIFSAPSGAGKSTLINFLLTQRRDLEFSISATTRAPRGVEEHGKEYYFISNPEFEQLIKEDQLVEWQQVYSGTYYGTLKSEIERIESAGHHVVFDVDVKGGINLKKIFGDNAHSIFVAPPSVAELRKRLIGRATDSPEKIEERVAKAAQEMEDAQYFDAVIVNDNLEKAKMELMNEVTSFLE
ncbi:MAG: guanylate kinase [Paludibacteraceae bacterium]|nr:guanylate kinase [Paludibacteraceae bacterium]